MLAACLSIQGPKGDPGIAGEPGEPGQTGLPGKIVSHHLCNIITNKCINKELFKHFSLEPRI